MKTLSLNKPKQPTLKVHPLDQFLGQRVVLQVGPVTHHGLLASIDPWIHLTTATITGNRKIAKVAEVFIARAALIAHLHLEADIASLEDV